VGILNRAYTAVTVLSPSSGTLQGGQEKAYSMGCIGSKQQAQGARHEGQHNNALFGLTNY